MKRDALAVTAAELTADAGVLRAKLDALREARAQLCSARTENVLLRQSRDKLARQVQLAKAQLRDAAADAGTPDAAAESLELRRQHRVHLATSFQLTEAIAAVKTDAAAADDTAAALQAELAEAIASHTKHTMTVRRLKRATSGLQARKYALQSEVIAGVGEKNELILTLEELAAAAADLHNAEEDHDALRAECVAELARNRELDAAVGAKLAARNAAAADSPSPLSPLASAPETSQPVPPQQAKRRSFVGPEIEAKLRELIAPEPVPLADGPAPRPHPDVTKVSAQSLFDAAAAVAASETSEAPLHRMLWDGGVEELTGASSMSSESPETSHAAVTANSLSAGSAHGVCSASSGSGSSSNALSASLEQRIKHATVPQLVEMMTHPRHAYLDLVQAFLLTFREFCSPLEFLELLIMRFCVTPPLRSDAARFTTRVLTPIRLRVFNLLKMWLTRFPADFGHVAAPELTAMLNDFVTRVMPATGMEVASRKLADLLDAAVATEASASITSIRVAEDSCPAVRGALAALAAPDAGVRTEADGSDVIDLGAAPKKRIRELAYALSMMEEVLFRSIPETEFVNLAWSSADKERRAPHLLRMIRFSGRVTRGVQFLVLRAAGVRARAKALRKAILLLDALMGVNNFNGAMEVMAALNSAALRSRSLKRVWAKLPSSATSLFDDHAATLSHQGSYKELRSALAAADPPLIPFVGMFLTDLTFIAGSRSPLPPPAAGIDAHVNMAKWYKYAKSIGLITRLQAMGYSSDRSAKLPSERAVWEWAAAISHTDRTLSTDTELFALADARADA
ncbi:cell division control protein [Thecamonas trahens ATCC 50062]|uniref:Cell division control protein n=1 Tax=Thecamonas trahens ATCC 50062 TaxID=461836 RepID=A0A0L0D736_THETB|nr:cell division control protein [Thecamonas trahens ATCC 50062]KNC48159.1 cell division control protein [Thecamonas trahens ATCC 50062]|eukprot:XP_013758729.1 cell division control protein [Thecamonas trahens ATCC 50062]